MLKNSPNNICIFIASSINTFDILEYSLEFNRNIYKELNIPVIVGCNGYNNANKRIDYEVIDCYEISDWNNEIIQQISILSKRYKKIILLLDDFLIFTINKNLLYHILDNYNNHSYLRLIPERFRLPILFPYILNLKEDIVPLNKNYKYYSALQISIWKVDYLLKLLQENSGTIWNFEHLKIGNHFYSTKQVVVYHHFIEKGKYRKSVIKKIKKTNKPEIKMYREIYNDITFNHFIRRIKFLIFGYYFSKI